MIKKLTFFQKAFVYSKQVFIFATITLIEKETQYRRKNH